MIYNSKLSGWQPTRGGNPHRRGCPVGPGGWWGRAPLTRIVLEELGKGRVLPHRFGESYQAVDDGAGATRSNSSSTCRCVANGVCSGLRQLMTEHDKRRGVVAPSHSVRTPFPRGRPGVFDYFVWGAAASQHPPRVTRLHRPMLCSPRPPHTRPHFSWCPPSSDRTVSMEGCGASFMCFSFLWVEAHVFPDGGASGRHL